MQNALLVYNPNSGGNRFNPLNSILRRFQSQNIQVQTFQLSRLNDHEILLQALSQIRFDLLIISGGDGTINFVVNLLLKNNISLPIGIIPAGTSNDLARNLKLPLDQKKAVDLIALGNTIAIDAGLMNKDNYFLSSCAGGLFTDISYKTEGDLKKNLGPLAYYLKGVQELSRIQPFRLTVNTATASLQEDILLFFILNGPHVAGLTDLVQEADPRDGNLHLVLIKKCEPLDLTGIFFNILGHISLKDHPSVTIISTSQFELKSEQEIILSIDGEKSGTLPAKLAVETKKLTVFSLLK
ncbi:MAG: YegS/Rv2252/BmrU family lipid kinase [Firmicutes bacterium]|nr:YegS/Rv2252/BmrU family lipid kinase [Bacillota bacterium]